MSINTLKQRFPSHGKERVHITYNNVSASSTDINVNIHLPINQKNTSNIKVLGKATN